MKPTELYEHFKTLIEKRGIQVSEQNFRSTGVKAKSGFCRVRGKDLFVIDKNKSMADKVEILGKFMATMSFENIYMLPAVREHLDKYQPKS
jgi:hypothetical protein